MIGFTYFKVSVGLDQEPETRITELVQWTPA